MLGKTLKTQRNKTSLNNQIETKNYRVRPDNGKGVEVLTETTLTFIPRFLSVWGKYPTAQRKRTENYRGEEGVRRQMIFKKIGRN